jgi:hypothetical protein
MTYVHEPGSTTRTGRPGEEPDTVASVFSEAAEQGGAVFSAGLRIWEDEATRYVEELTAQGQRTLDRLCDCKTPLDILSIEQEWLRARSQFYLESGVRFADAFADAAREVDGSASEKTAAAKPRRGRA